MNIWMRSETSPGVRSWFSALSRQSVSTVCLIHCPHSVMYVWFFKMDIYYALFCFQLVLITFDYSQVLFHPLRTAALMHVLWQGVKVSAGCTLRAGLMHREMTGAYNYNPQQGNNKQGFWIRIHFLVFLSSTSLSVSFTPPVFIRCQFK